MKFLISRIFSEIELDQVEKTIIYIESGGKQRQTTELKNTDGIKLQKEMEIMLKRTSERLKKPPNQGMSQKIGTKDDHEEHQ